MHADLTLAPNVTDRTMRRAVMAAVKTGTATCSVGLVDGTVHDFTITEVMHDALLGARVAAPSKACLIQFSGITTIEFG